MIENILHRSELGDLIDSRNLFGNVAEIGVAQGLHARDICRWSKRRLVYLVDAWASRPDVRGDAASHQGWHDRNYDAVVKLANEFAPRVIILRGDSAEMATHVPDGSLALVYLDACHYEPHVTADLKAWLPKLIAGGIMAGHDYLAPEYDVNKAVNAFATNVRTIVEHKACDAGFWFTKEDAI